MCAAAAPKCSNLHFASNGTIASITTFVYQTYFLIISLNFSFRKFSVFGVINVNEFDLKKSILNANNRQKYNILSTICGHIFSRFSLHIHNGGINWTFFFCVPRLRSILFWFICSVLRSNACRLYVELNWSWLRMSIMSLYHRWQMLQWMRSMLNGEVFRSLEIFWFQRTISKDLPAGNDKFLTDIVDKCFYKYVVSFVELAKLLGNEMNDI